MQHKFLERNDLPFGFSTNDTILKSEEYCPITLFVGTYNPNWDWNPADFFYGRGMYMWPILANLFLYNENILFHPRNGNNNQPTLQQIYEICKKGKISFADIIKGVKNDIPINVNNQQRTVQVNNEFVWQSYKDGELDFMGNQNWLDDNINAIADYIINTPSIKHVYFTFKSGSWIVEKKRELTNTVNQNRNDVTFENIFSPSGNGFGHLMPQYNQRCWSITHCWIWNGLNHNTPINRIGYGHLDHSWLRSCGVEPTNF